MANGCMSDHVTVFKVHASTTWHGLPRYWHATDGMAVKAIIESIGEGCLKSDGSVKSDTSEIVQQLTINLIYIQNFEIFKKMAVPSLDKNIFYSFSTILVAISLVQNSMQNFLLILHWENSGRGKCLCWLRLVLNRPRWCFFYMKFICVLM